MAMIQILNTRRSALSFQLQPLALRLVYTAFDKKRVDSDLVLVVKGNVVSSCTQYQQHLPQQPRAATSAGTASEEKLPLLDAPSPPSTAEKGTGTTAPVPETSEKISRSPPFRIRSATTVLSSSFAIPADFLVGDVARSRGGSGASGTQRRRSISKAGTGIGTSAVRGIVIELAECTGTPQNRGVFYGSALKRIGGGVDACSNGTEYSDNVLGKVLARAYLDPEFLRRTIGAQRSVDLVLPRENENSDDNMDGRREGQQQESDPERLFARLEVAGHAVAARREPRPHLKLEVLECQNLNKADVLGKSDPCVLVFWNGSLVGRTPIARSDLHPVFNDVFRLPLEPSDCSSPLGASQSTKQRKSTGQGGWKHYAPELHFEVWDMDRDTFTRKWEKGELLGSVTLRGPCGITPVLQASATVRMEARASAVSVSACGANPRGVFVRWYRHTSGGGSCRLQQLPRWRWDHQGAAHENKICRSDILQRTVV